MIALSLLCYTDRTNVAYAALQMKSDLALTDAEYSQSLNKRKKASGPFIKEMRLSNAWKTRKYKDERSASGRLSRAKGACCAGCADLRWMH